MLGVAVLLASSSMAAIELITLYAWLDNAVHKMAPPPSATHPPPRLPSLLSARRRKDLCIALEELEYKVSSLLSVGAYLCTPNNEEMLLLCRAAGL